MNLQYGRFDLVTACLLNVVLQNSLKLNHKIMSNVIISLNIVPYIRHILLKASSIIFKPVRRHILQKLILLRQACRQIIR